MRRPHCCHISLSFVLKFLNFLQAFVGVSIIVYSAWMINRWNHRIPLPPHTTASLPIAFNFRTALLSGFDDGLGFYIKLPAPWFIYSFMGVGILLCCVTFIGCVAAELINGCCLCFYMILDVVLLLLEAALVGFIAFDHHWEEDLPFDPTGVLESLRLFVEANQDICKWVGMIVVVVQALALLLALILRATISTPKGDSDDEDEYGIRGKRGYEPLLSPQSGQPSGSTKGDNRATISDVWSSRIREKYGLNSVDKYTSPIQNSSQA